jgi:septal ring factor EnvC (AmiA/AmiB activator)
MQMKRLLISLLILAVCTPALLSQSVKDLQSERKRLQDELSLTSKLLDETQRSKSSSLNKLTIIRKNISSRTNLIDNLNLQIAVLDRNLDTLRLQKDCLTNRLQQLKNEYARLLQESQMRKNSYSQLLFLFSSESMEQAYRRMRYLQESSEYRKKQALEIQHIQQQIAGQETLLSQTRQTKESTRTQQEKESKQLQQEQQKEGKTLGSLKTQENKLRQQLTLQQKKANELNRRIEQAIAAEIQRAEARKRAQQAKEEAARREAEKREAQKQGKTPKPSVSKPAEAPAASGNVETLTREESLAAGNFAANKGHLPWPVEKGFIRGHFGIQPHPVLKHVTTNNKGIYIQTPRNSDARAIFEGVVTQVFSVPGSNNGVIIKHGNYRSVYANLTGLYIKEGDHVSAKQRIGKIFVDDENGGKTELYLMIWKDKTLLNPEQWITR